MYFLYQANSVGIVEILYAVIHQTSSPDDVELIPSGNIVRFSSGQTQASITVNVLDDFIPEEQELLMLTLVSVSAGDAVLVSPAEATLVIYLSDDPNGVFEFSDDLVSVEAEEGEMLRLMYVHNNIKLSMLLPSYIHLTLFAGLLGMVDHLVLLVYAG